MKLWKHGVVALVAGVMVAAAPAGAAGEKARVLFDQGHEQRFLIEDEGTLQLSRLAGTVRGRGAQAEATRTPLTAEQLKGVTAVVISGPFAALTPSEVDAVARFVEQGGRLAVMLHIADPLEGLLDRLGVAHTNMVLRERNNVIDQDINFRVTRLAADPLTAGLAGFSVYGVWGLHPGDHGISLASTTEGAWVDMDGNKILSRGDAVGRFDVAVSGTLGAGGFVVFGDDAIFQNRFLDANNQRLAENLAAWLAGK